MPTLRESMPPAVKVDSRPIGTGKPGPVMADLEERFHALTRA